MLRQYDLAGPFRKSALCYMNRHDRIEIAVCADNVDIRRILVFRIGQDGIANILTHCCLHYFRVVYQFRGFVRSDIKKASVPVAVIINSHFKHIPLKAGNKRCHGSQHCRRQNNADYRDQRSCFISGKCFHRDAEKNVHVLFTSSRVILPSSIAIMRSACKAIFSS